MTLLTTEQRRAAEAIARIGYTNPFLPERVELERAALGAKMIPSRPWFSFEPGAATEDLFPNVPRLRTLAGELAERLRTARRQGEPFSDADCRLYQTLTYYVLYSRFMSPFGGVIGEYRNATATGRRIEFWETFLDTYRYYFASGEWTLPVEYAPAHVFACFYQFERAFQQIFSHLVGASLPMARLRAAVWQSIFTHDLDRYARALYAAMHDVPTLITGPSGTGKELVARAIGLSRYVPFNTQTKSFDVPAAESFVPINLSAVPTTLIESELFGHRKGAFTGAVEDRTGRLDCPDRQSTIFLDEIGELEPAIQVKLLRVLQTRSFQRIGEFRDRTFAGKIIAATNRDLSEELRAGRFREDFYYRLCADTITTPALREQLADEPADLATFVQFITRTLLPDLPAESEQLSHEAVAWIGQHLDADYAWPGNIRELEQCVRNVMVRGRYEPLTRPRPLALAPRRELADDVAAGRLSSDELLRRYYSLVYAEAGSYRAAAARLAVDWRTVEKRIDGELVEQFRC